MVTEQEPPFFTNCPLCGEDICVDLHTGVTTQCPDKECPAHEEGSFELIVDIEGVAYLVETR